jgi:cyclase
VLKVRLIPVLLLRNGELVRSEDFRIHQVIGDPLHEVKRFNEWNVDELIYIDITKGDYSFRRRSDHKTKGMEEPTEIVAQVSKSCFIPLTWGGRVRTVDDAATLFRSGADKITLNTCLFDCPKTVTSIVKRYGSQAVVASVDVMRHGDGSLEVFKDGGMVPTGHGPNDWARRAEDLGVGEIFLQAIHKDGKGTGYDLDLLNGVCRAVTIPVIACSGVGTYEHYAAAVKAGASAVAAANIWHFKELSDRNSKRALQRAGVNVRIR